jgi:6-pyruvoyl-tetrahydropterin synthase
MIEVHSTKKYVNLPCGHAQFFDKKANGTPGHCAAVHGYDRSVEITFSGTVDENGWIVPFGGLQKVKQFIEYYQDHVTCLPANDPRLEKLIQDGHTAVGGVLGTLRVLPYGVSMEMTSLFLWEHLSLFITHMTQGRCYISKLQVFEHERNSGFVTVDRKTAMTHYDNYKKSIMETDPLGEGLLTLEWYDYSPILPFEAPQDALNRLNEQ